MTRLLLLTFCLSATLNLAIGERIRYDNYEVYQINPQTDKDIELLRTIDDQSDSVIFLDGIIGPRNNVSVIVAPHKQPDFLQFLNQNDLQYLLLEENVQRTLDKELVKPRLASTQYDWTRYHTLGENYAWLETLAKKYPTVQLLVGGTTYEGRKIRGVKISYKPGNKGIFIEGGIHAREWISPATVTYIVNQLLTDKDPAIRELAENYDWYVFPHTNPDGYVYTHKTNRLWRKTRSRQGSCYGADPNRNWNFHWKEIGASSSPCSETFAGPKAFSEIETRSLSKYIASLKGKIHTYLSFHSFSQFILFPYGHTKQHAENYDDLEQVGDAAAKALSKRYGTKYVVGTTYEVLYPAAGMSIDWVYGKLDVPLTYCFELRPPKGTWNGFVLPPEKIIPTGEETMDSLVALVDEANGLGYL